jgi:pimeloyl-ACP methyl ester carboxylesterase
MAIERAVSASKEPVIVVGHGSSGVVISAVAEAMPQRIASLVYVAAYVPKNGQSIMDLSLADTGKAVNIDNWLTDEAKTIGGFAAEDRVSIFCADCSAAFQTYVTQRFQPEPLRPMSDKVNLSLERFGRVKKAYVFTTQNKAISHAYQRAMVNDPRIRSYTLNTSHLPFFTQPANLANILMTEAVR